MRNSRRFALSAVLALVAGSAHAASPSGDPIFVGVIGGTTGAYGNVGKQAQQGAMVALDKITAQGGIMGRPLKIEMVNDNADGTLAGQLFQKFVSAGAVAISGSPDNGPVTAQLAARFKIPDIGVVDGGGLTVYPDGPDKPPNHWAFSGGNSFAWGEAIGNYAAKHCQKGLAILHDISSYGMSGFASIKDAYEKSGKKIALDRPISENWTTGAIAQLTPELAAVKKAGVDCVDVWLSPADQAAFVQLLRTSGEHYLVLGNADTNADDSFTSLAGADAQGVVSALITGELHHNDLYKEFADAYHKKYNEEPSQASEMTYQAIITLAHLIEKTKSTDHAVLRDALDASSPFPGILGDAGFTPTRHVSVTGTDMTLVQYDVPSKTWVEIHE